MPPGAPRDSTHPWLPTWAPSHPPGCAPGIAPPSLPATPCCHARLLTVPQQAELLLALLPPCMPNPPPLGAASGSDGGAAAGPSSPLLPWQRAQLLGWLAAMLWQAVVQPGAAGQAAGGPGMAADQVLPLVARLGQPRRTAGVRPARKLPSNSSAHMQELPPKSGWRTRAALPLPWRGAVSDASSSSSSSRGDSSGGGNALAVSAPRPSGRRAFDIWRRSEQPNSPLSPDSHAAAAQVDSSWALAAGQAPRGVHAPVPAVPADADLAAAVAAAHAALDRTLWLAAQALELTQGRC